MEQTKASVRLGFVAACIITTAGTSESVALQTKLPIRDALCIGLAAFLAEAFVLFHLGSRRRLHGGGNVLLHVAERDAIRTTQPPQT